MNSLKRLVALVLAGVLLLSCVPSVLAAVEPKDEGYSFDYEAHNALQELKKVSTMALRPVSQVLRNEYVEFYVDDDESGQLGRFTIGNVEGNPQFDDDDDKILMFGHPDPWSSYTTIRINNIDYIFNADETLYDAEALKAVSTMTVDDVLITQTLQIVGNAGSGIADTVRIGYTAQNLSNTSKNIGIRILMDTMLGDNDGAPFKIPSLGNVVTETELTGNSIPRFWQAFDDLDNPSVFAVGTFYKQDERKPDKVQFAAWPDIYHSDYRWSYTTTPGRSVTGDSAVAVYWNPVPVEANSSTSVSTYYGAGVASNPEDVGLEVAVPQNGFCIQIMDENGQPVDGANVEILNSYPTRTEVTANGGVAIFSEVPTDVFTNGASLRISKDGYQAIAVNRAVSRGSITAATIYEDDGKAHVISAEASIDNTTLDVLNYYRHFKENVDSATAANDESNVKKLKIQVSASGPAKINKYQIIQGGQVVFESQTNEITIPVYTGTPSEPNKYKDNWRIEGLTAGKDVFLRVVDANGNASKQKRIGISVSKPTLYGMSDTEGTLEFGKELKITVPSDIPILGDTEIEIGWNGLPFKFDISEDGKVKFAINPETNLQTGEVDWGNTKKDFDDKQLKAINNRLDAGKAFGGKPQTFGAGSFDVKANIMGYGEGFIDDNGNFSVNVGLVISVWEQGEYTWTFFLGYVPVYVAVGEKFQLNVSGQLNITSSNGRLQVTGLDGELNPEFTLNVDGGVGANGVLNIGASGRAKVSWKSYFANDYQRLDLTGSVHIVAQAFLFKAEKKLAEGTWTIYESGSRNYAARYAAVRNDDFHDAAAYTPIDRSYLDAPTPYFLDSSTVKYGVYPDASPVLVKSGDVSYLFWLNDIATREDNDRTALVYATRTNDEHDWSEPVQIFEETENSTADLAFDVSVDGSDIHLVVSKASERFEDAEITIEDIAESSEIYYAKIDTLNNSISTKKITTDSYADIMPQIVAYDGDAMIAYTTNQMEDGLFGSNSTHKISLVDVEEWTTKTISTDGLVMDVAVGALNNSVKVAYVLDSDSDYSTSEDSELWLWDGVQSTDVSTSGVEVSNPQFLNTNQNEALLWYENNNIWYSTDGLSVSQVFDSAPYNLSSNFSVITGNGDPQIVWAASSDDEDSNTTSVFAAKYLNNKWSSVYKLYDSDSEFTATVNGYSVDDTTYLAHLETYADDESQISSLCVSAVSPDVDIELNSVNYSELDVKPGEEFPLSITVSNKGSKPVDTVYVNICNDDEQVKTITLENMQLGCGETKDYELDDFVIPETIEEPETYTIEIWYEDEACYDFSEKSITIGYTDLEIQLEKSLVDDSDFANIMVKNLTNIPTDAILRISADEEDGAILYEKRLANVSKEHIISTLVNLTQLSSGVDVQRFYIEVISEKEELLQLDNHQVINAALNREKKYKLNVVTDECGTVIGDIGGQFVPGEEITITAVSNGAWWAFNGWSANGNVDFSDASADTVTFTMPSYDLTVYANFQDVSIKTSVSPSAKYLHQEQTYQLQYIIHAQEDFSETIYWTSSNPSVATVDENGSVTALLPGVVEITLHSTNPLIRPSSCRIEVIPTHVITNQYLDLESEHPYHNSSQMTWVYSQPSVSEINLTFSEETELESGYDYVEIYDSDFNLIKSYTGMSLAGETVKILGNKAILRLSTDSSVTKWGFKVVDCSLVCTQHTYDSAGDADCNICGDIRRDLNGWLLSENKWSFYENGAKVTQWKFIGNSWYFFNQDGVMQTGWQRIGGVWYYLNDSGAMATGWQYIGGSWYFFNASGAMQTGWQRIGGVWYYLNDGGAMATGWQYIGSSWYFFNASGAMQTGWQLTGGVWYFLNDGGAMATGWQYIGSSWYFFNASGVMQTGWIYDGTWYYLNASGVMATGWQYIGGSWYFFNVSGAMQTGWIYDGSWYYLNASGVWVG